MRVKRKKRNESNTASTSSSTKKSSSDSKNQSRGPAGPRRELFPSRNGTTPKTETMLSSMRNAGVRNPGIFARGADGKPDQKGLTYEANKAGVLNDVTQSNKKSSYPNTRMTGNKVRPRKKR